MYDRFIFNTQDVEKKRTFLYQYNDSQFRIVSMKVATRGKVFEEIKSKTDFVKHAEKHDVMQKIMGRGAKKRVNILSTKLK